MEDRKNNKSNKKNPWQYIHDAIDSIEDYYGFNFRTGFSSRVSSDIVNELLEFCSHQLPHEIYARCIDGKIRKGKLTSRMAIDVIASRHVLNTKVMTDDAWKTILTKTDNRYTYCFDKSTFHPEIMPDVGLYMMKHNLSYNIYRVVLNDVNLSETVGESAKVFDKYIKSEKSIQTKKDMFAQQMGFDERDLRSDYFAWKYVKKLIMDNEPECEIAFDKEKLDAIKKLAYENDIVYTDLLHRMKLGIPQDKALRMCLDESEKYGFKYVENDIRVYGPSGSHTMRGTNYNLMMYIKYLASLEDLGEIEH